MRNLGQNYSERVDAGRSRLALEQMAEEIARHIPRMRALTSDADFWYWLKGEIDSVRRNARTTEEKERLTDKLRQAAGAPAAVVNDFQAPGA